MPIHTLQMNFTARWAAPVCAALLAIVASAAPAHAQAPASAPPPEGEPAPLGHPRKALVVPGDVPPLAPRTPLRVGTCDMPPWSVPPSKNNPAWSGVAIHLLEEIGAGLDLDIQLRAYDYDGLLTAVERGDVDIAGTGLPITAENLARFSMTPAFDQSGLSIATHLRPPLSFWTVIDRVTTRQVLLWSGTLAIMCVIFGALLWSVERKRNPPFEGAPARGIAEASWWSVVTMFTVGYGDRVPVTLRGKLIAVSWMSLAFILVTVASGLVTSALTVQQLRPIVAGPHDLSKARVGCVVDTDGQAFLRSTNIAFTEYPSYEAAVHALATGREEALVGSTVVMAYLVDRSHAHSLAVLPQRLRTDYVGFGMRYGMPDALEKRFELEMLKIAQSDEFRGYRNTLMGDAARGED